MLLNLGLKITNNNKSFRLFLRYHLVLCLIISEKILDKFTHPVGECLDYELPEIRLDRIYSSFQLQKTFLRQEEEKKKLGGIKAQQTTFDFRR